MNKKRIWILVVAFLVTCIISFLVINSKNGGWLGKIICESRGGEYDADDLRGNRYCFPKDIPAAARKTLVGKVLEHPDNVNAEIKFITEKDGVVEGYVRNKESKKKTSARVYAYINRILVQLYSKSSFYMPFYIEDDKGRTAYLGLFYFFQLGADEKDNNFYENAYLINSYAFKDNIEIDEIKQIRTGSYSNLFSILVHDAESPQEKKSIDLRYYYELGRYVEKEGCVEPKKVISRERGDGKSYEICLFENGNECALDTYEKGDCPFYGYNVSQISDEMVKYGIVKGQLVKDGVFHFKGEDINYKIEDFYFGRREFQD